MKLQEQLRISEITREKIKYYIKDEKINKIPLISDVLRNFGAFCNIFEDFSNSNNDICTYVETPEYLHNKKCVVNIKNENNRCFQYSIVKSVYHDEINNNINRVSSVEPYIDCINWKNITFPPTRYDYEKFEKNNRSMALFVLNYGDNGKITHIFNSNYIKEINQHVILLLLENKHYVTVTRLNALIRDSNNSRMVYCIHCLQPFSKKKFEKRYESIESSS